MDSAVSTAARALSAGDPLAALKLVGLRTDPPGLALRGIAMAQLGELAKALSLLRRAAKAFGDAEPIAKARSTVAGAEVALALRHLGSDSDELDEAVVVLERGGDAVNATFARLVQARRLVLLGQVEAATRALDELALAQAPPRLVALAQLVAADVAVKRGRAGEARRVLALAERAGTTARIPALAREVAAAQQRLKAPVARLRRGGEERSVNLAEVERLFASGQLVIDACRREVRQGDCVVSLLARPVLFELLLALAERAPDEVTRELLIVRVFAARRPNESHRARLRVEVGRLRPLLERVASVRATRAGFALVPSTPGAPALLLPPGDGQVSELWALLRGGEAWSTSALATALSRSQRSVQRALAELEADARVRASGRGRARRWVAAPSSGIATTLLLAAPGTLG